MSEDNMTLNTEPQDLNATEDVLPERLIKTADAIHTGGDTKRIFIPEKAAPAKAPERKFIKTNEPDFVSVRAEEAKAAEATEITNYADRLDVSPSPENVHTGHTGKIETYDTVHAPENGGRMIVPADEAEQLSLDGAAPDEPTREADPAEFAEPSDVIPEGSTKAFDPRFDRLKEIADTANDDVRRNPDQMMMEGFAEIGKKTEEELKSEEALRDELKNARAERVKNFRFWDKAPQPKEPGEPAETDEKFSHTKKSIALPAFAAKFSERFAHIPTPFTPVKAAEYTDGGSRKAVFDAVKQSRTRALIFTVALAAFALILLITDAAAKVTAGNNSGFFTIMGGNVNALATFNLIFLLLSCAVMFPDLKNGAVSVLKLRPKTEALLLLTMLSALTQNIGAFLTQQKLASDFQLLAPAAVLVCVPYMLARVFYYDNARQVFKTVSAKSDKSYLRCVTDPELRARLGCEDGQNAVYAGRTRAVAGFPHSIEESARGEMPASRVAAVLGGVSLLTALITLIVKKSLMSGLTVLTLCLTLALPVCSLVALGFFLSRTNGKLSLKSSFIQSFGDAKTFSAIDSIVCDAAELFDAEIVNCLTAKGVSEKQVRFAAASAAAGAGSMIRKVFAPEIETYADKMPPAKNTVYEDKMGVSAYVGGCTVLLGNHDMMLNHNVEVPNEDAVMRFLGEGETPLYLAMEGRFTALFAVKYTAPEEVQRGMKELVNGGAAILLSTTDPNVSDAAAEAILGLAENSVRMINSTAAKKLSAACDTVADAVETGVVFTDSFLSLARVAVQAVKLDSLNTVIKAVCLAGAFVSLFIGVVMAFTGAFASVTAFTVLALHVIWTGLCFLSPFFNESAVKLLRRISALRKKEAPAEAAPAETAQEAPAPEFFGEEAPQADQLLMELPAEDAGDEPPAAPAEDAADAADTEAPVPEKTAPAPDELDEFLLPETAAPDTSEAAEAAPAEKEEDDVLASLETTFAPKDEAPKKKEPEEAPGRFIASAAFKKTLSSVDDFYANLTAGNPAAQAAEGKAFSLYGKNPGARRVKNADDIESDYERKKADENALRRAFTAPETPEAPIYDLRRKAPEPKAEDPAPPLDTSDVNVYNEELFRRFEDDSIFSGLHDGEEPQEYHF